MYKKYYNAKIKLWYDSNIRFDIRSEPAHNLWFIIKGKTDLYDSKDKKIKRWCQEIDSKHKSLRQSTVNDLQIDSLLIGSEINLYSMELGGEPRETQMPIMYETEIDVDNSDMEMNDDSNKSESIRNLSCPGLSQNSTNADIINKINEQSKTLELLGIQMNEIRVLLEEIKGSKEDKPTCSSVDKSQDSSNNVDLNGDSFDCFNHNSVDNEKLEVENISFHNEPVHIAQSKEAAYGDDEIEEESLILSYTDIYGIMKFREFNVNELLIALNENLSIEVEYCQLKRILDDFVSQRNLYYNSEEYYRCNLYLRNGKFKSFNDLITLINSKYNTKKFDISEFTRHFHSSARPEKNQLIDAFDEMVYQDFLRCIEINGKLIYFLE